MIQVKLPPTVRTVRHVPSPQVAIPDGAPPLIDPKDPDHKQVQEIWTARVKMFRLDNADEVKALEEVWQNVCDRRAVVSEHQTQWSAQHNTFVSMVRWADLSYVAPTST